MEIVILEASDDSSEVELRELMETWHSSVRFQIFAENDAYFCTEDEVHCLSWPSCSWKGRNSL